jgi:hypothetical protein
MRDDNPRQSHPDHDRPSGESRRLRESAPAPLPNYTLSTVCPACNAPTYRLACKVRCDRCGFVWDCSEL